MAQMMPAYCPPECLSPAEPEIFARLRDAPETDDWIVLHSLDIAQHVSQLSGEADFLAIVPGLGVLCLEVKGAKTVRRTAAGWQIGRNAKLDVRGPFRQAADAMHSLRRTLLDERPDLSAVLFASAVVMPFVPFDERSGEWHDWQVIDSQKYKAKNMRELILGVLASARQFAASRPTGAWFDQTKSAPTAQQVLDIARVLRPQFEINESPRARARRETAEIRKYTQEQYVALDAMEANPRVLFEGPAGTGKTLLAIEAVRRSSSRGERVLFLCFNRLLSRWLAAECAPLGETVTVASLHAYMLKIAGMQAAPPDASSSFWEQGLPEAALAALVEGSETVPFDSVVLDEAQDVLRLQYIDVLDLSLRSGLSDGPWLMFGDLQGQDIYGATTSLDVIRQDKRLAGTPRYALRKNCRNTPRVSALVAPFGGISPDYSGVLRLDDGIEPEWRYYSGPQNQGELLTNALDGLLREGYRRHEIVVLSPLSDTRSAAASLASTRPDLVPFEFGVNGKIRYCSVHAFKGLESRAVVVTDVGNIDRSDQRALLYVAVTRSTGRLVMCLPEGERAEVIRTMLESMTTGGMG